MLTDHADKRPERRWNLPSSWVIEVKPRRDWTPVFQNPLESATREMLDDELLENESQTGTVQRSPDHQHRVVGHQWSADVGLQARANPAVRQAQELLAANAIGRPLTARMVSTTAGFGPNPDHAVAYTENPSNGVSVITVQAAHSTDLAMALLGGVAAFSALATTQFPTIRIGNGEPQPRKTYDHLLVQARLAGGAALSVEVAGGRPLETPFLFEIIGDAGVMILQGGAPRGFQSGRLRLLVNGEVQAVDEGELVSLSDAALNVAATYAAFRDDIVRGTFTVAGFPHAARLAQFIEDAVSSSDAGERKENGKWPSA